MSKLYFFLAFLVGCAATGSGADPTASSSHSQSSQSAAKKPRPDKLENIPLVWKPTSLGSMASVDLTGLEDAKLRIDRLADDREDSGLIGQNFEETPRKVSTRDDVPAFVTDHMKTLISRVGIDVGASGATAILKGEIKQFVVDETEIYKGDVRLRLTLTNPAGDVLWTNTVRGTAVRFGRSYRAENYYETLSDSLVQATYHLVQDAGFRKALAGR